MRCLVSYAVFAAFFSSAAVVAAATNDQAKPAWPLHTQGRYIVDSHNQRFKLASVNWYGASDVDMVAGGLATAALPDIVKAVRASGFNSVRLPFSNQMLHVSSTIEPRTVAANPGLIGRTPLEALDAVVAELTKQGIGVILNNHTTHAMWCCTYDQDGLWYTKDFSAQQWVDDWAMLASRYRNNPGVIGMDLRNEIRITMWNGTILPVAPTWGFGPNDWRAAAEWAGNRILEVNPQVLIISEGINFPRDHLRFVIDQPIRLNVPDRLVYAAHNYSHTKPDEIFGRQTYGSMDYPTFRDRMDSEWGFVLKENQAYTAPVWMSEFGAPIQADGLYLSWFANITRYLNEKDVDFAYWAINAGARPNGSVETFSWLDLDWQTTLVDWREAKLRPLFTPQHGPGVDADWDKHPAHHFEALMVSDWDNDRSSGRGREDWLPQAFKAVCRDDCRLVGLSGGERELRPFTHLALCSDYMSPGPATGYTVLRNNDRDSGAVGSHGLADWAPGENKLECPPHSYVRGIAQQRSPFRFWTSGLQCATSVRELGQSCHVQRFADHDSLATNVAGDWDLGKHKGQCGEKEYVAGISFNAGVAQSLLCCSLN